MKKKLFALLSALLSLSLQAQNVHDDGRWQSVHNYFSRYSLPRYVPANRMAADSVTVDSVHQEIRIYANEAFCAQPLTSERVERIYDDLRQVLPQSHRDSRLVVCSPRGTLLEELVPNVFRTEDIDETRLWKKANYDGQPWVKNTSLPYEVTDGLQKRHLFIWPSHGRYYHSGQWLWQRPLLYATCEDALTQSFVYPYLFPMLERAGAVVCCPRERDVQSHEAIVDNDAPQRQGIYSESGNDDVRWFTPETGMGFAAPQGLLNDSVFPFQLGTFRAAKSQLRKSKAATATWMPRIPKTGRYAVYVSYATLPNSIPDAHYTVYHAGGMTQLQVNQRMGGGTWVYLGTFDFNEGCSKQGCVVLSNYSDYRGVVSADGVRFGGGVGQHVRDTTGTVGTSGLPRFLEAARYYAHWAGIPDSLVNTEHGSNDYTDDLRVRANMLNYLSGGSIYQPENPGKGVPFELSLAIHTDAGYRRDNSIFGSLSICTTQDGEGNSLYTNGLSRLASSDFSALLLDNLTRDLTNRFHINWTQREHWDRNYAETRMPGVPSAILETLSHQSFSDMKYAHDPVFKFFLARSIYKTILQFVHYEHGDKDYTVQPLPVHAFSVRLSPDGGQAKLTWSPTLDSCEPTAAPTGYVVYTKVGDEAFDNGLAIGNDTTFTLAISPGRIYSFCVTAINKGGESFPSETLSLYRATKERFRALIVNGFTRLSGPARIEMADSLGFDLDRDLGVPYLYTTAYTGRQKDFRSGKSGNELAGQIFAGNTFDYPLCHGKAVAASSEWSFDSSSREAFEAMPLTGQAYHVIDYIAGLECDAPHNLVKVRTFPQKIRKRLTEWQQQGGALLVSGSYIASDARTADEKAFLANVLHCKGDGNAQSDSTDIVKGLNMAFEVFRQPNSEHYAAQAPDAVLPSTSEAFSSFAYGNGLGAGVAYKGGKHTSSASGGSVITMGFPFECIKDEKTRAVTMQAILNFLTE